MGKVVVYTSTSGGGGGDYLPLTGGTMTGPIEFTDADNGGSFELSFANAEGNEGNGTLSFSEYGFTYANGNASSSGGSSSSTFSILSGASSNVGIHARTNEGQTLTVDSQIAISTPSGSSFTLNPGSLVMYTNYNSTSSMPYIMMNPGYGYFSLNGGNYMYFNTSSGNSIYYQVKGGNGTYVFEAGRTAISMSNSVLNSNLIINSGVSMTIGGSSTDVSSLGFTGSMNLLNNNGQSYYFSSSCKSSSSASSNDLSSSTTLASNGYSISFRNTSGNGSLSWNQGSLGIYTYANSSYSSQHTSNFFMSLTSTTMLEVIGRYQESSSSTVTSKIGVGPTFEASQTNTARSGYSLTTNSSVFEAKGLSSGSEVYNLHAGNSYFSYVSNSKGFQYSSGSLQSVGGAIDLYNFNVATVNQYTLGTDYITTNITDITEAETEWIETTSKKDLLAMIIELKRRIEALEA